MGDRHCVLVGRLAGAGPSFTRFTLKMENPFLRTVALTSCLKMIMSVTMGHFTVDFFFRCIGSNYHDIIYLDLDIVIVILSTF
jgi:hypothetical protein